MLRLTKALAFLLGAALLWRLRLFQLAIFGVSSLIRGRRLETARSGPAEQVAPWAGVTLPPTHQRSRNEFTLLSYHPEYHDYRPSLVLNALTSAVGAGAGWIRTDIRWREVLPDGVTPHGRALDWYRSYLNAAASLGLKNMVVLSTPPKTVLEQNTRGRLDSWTYFVRLVVNELGEKCNAYQLLNEPNNPVYAFLPRREAAEAIARGADVIHRTLASAEVAVNVSMDIWGWKSCLETLLAESGRAVQIVGIDHYPGTWTVGNGDRWADAVEIADAIATAPAGTLWSGRRLAVLETGYSTNVWARTQKEQVKYFSKLAAAVESLKSHSGALGVLIGVYELCDGDSAARVDPEAHFGILTTDLRPKAGYDEVRRLFASI